MKDFAFDDTERTETTLDMAIIPALTTMPAEFPKKQEIRDFRKVLLEELTGRMDPLDAYIMVKLMEKILAEKDEGLTSLMKEHAMDAFLKRFGGSKTEEIRGVKVSIKGATTWQYPAHIAEMEKQLDLLKADIAAEKKKAEITGDALATTIPAKTISITF